MADSHVRVGRLRRAFEWLPRTPDPPREVTLRSGAELLVRRGDAIPLLEQFALDVYAVPLPGPPVRSILDLGANVGFASIALAARHPGARIVCVEPEPSTRELLARNLARNGVEAEILALAVGGAPGSVSLRYGEHHSLTRTQPDPAGEIRAAPLAEMLDLAGLPEVDLVKIDAEGAEREVLADVGAWADRVGAIIGELHDGLTRELAYAQLRPHGFEPVALPDRPYLDGIFCAARAARA
jgi:FkbM family methyltransferase